MIHLVASKFDQISAKKTAVINGNQWGKHLFCWETISNNYESLNFAGNYCYFMLLSPNTWAFQHLTAARMGQGATAIKALRDAFFAEPNG